MSVEHAPGMPNNCVFEGNGNLVCRNDGGRFDIYHRGEGWWVFDIASEREAIDLAQRYPEATATVPAGGAA